MSEQLNVSPNPWVVRAGGGQRDELPVGSYVGVFEGIEDVTLKDSSVKWRFRLKAMSGEHEGKYGPSLVDRGISPTVLPGTLIAGLLGRAVVPGENVEQAVNACKGQTYMFNVAIGPKGGKPQVRFVSKPPAM